MNFAAYDPASFDATVAASMRQRYSPIVVNFNNLFPLNEPPPALDRWLSAIRQTGGQVVVCALTEKEFFRELIPWITELADIALDAWTFRPAAAYNVIAYENPETQTVSRVEFHERSTSPPC